LRDQSHLVNVKVHYQLLALLPKPAPYHVFVSQRSTSSDLAAILDFESLSLV
jgi:hypothetical protein